MNQARAPDQPALLVRPEKAVAATPPFPTWAFMPSSRRPFPDPAFVVE